MRSFLSPTSRASKSVFFGVRCLGAGLHSATLVSMGYPPPSPIFVIAPRRRPTWDLYAPIMTPSAIPENCKHLWSLRTHFNPMGIIVPSSRERSLSHTLSNDSCRRTRSKCALKTSNTGGIQTFEVGVWPWCFSRYPLYSPWSNVHLKMGYGRRCRAGKRFLGHASVFSFDVSWILYSRIDSGAYFGKFALKSLSRDRCILRCRVVSLSSIRCSSRRCPPCQTR
jgi:hypothetical protein